MKLYIKIALFAVVFFAIAAILVALTLYFKKHADLSRVKPDYVLTATALQKEFEENESAASSKYINKVLEVTGTIASITPADSSNFNMSLNTGSDISSVICTFSSSLDPKKFNPGEEITIRGECSGFLMDVLLNNCAPVNSLK